MLTLAAGRFAPAPDFTTGCCEDRIAIADHLEGCPVCRVEANDLAAISGALHATARTEDVAVMPGLNRLQADILERWDAEENASLSRTIRDLVDDPRRASASVGVSVVASFCLAFGAFVLAQSPIRIPNRSGGIDAERSARTGAIYLPEAFGELQLPIRKR